MFLLDFKNDHEQRRTTKNNILAERESSKFNAYFINIPAYIMRVIYVNPRINPITCACGAIIQRKSPLLTLLSIIIPLFKGFRKEDSTRYGQCLLDLLAYMTGINEPSWLFHRPLPKSKRLKQGIGRPLAGFLQPTPTPDIPSP